MLSHVLVFAVAIRELSDTAHMLMTIASALFFIETGAFLLVVTLFRRQIVATQNEPLNSDADGLC